MKYDEIMWEYLTIRLDAYARRIIRITAKRRKTWIDRINLYIYKRAYAYFMQELEDFIPL